MRKPLLVTELMRFFLNIARLELTVVDGRVEHFSFEPGGVVQSVGGVRPRKKAGRRAAPEGTKNRERGCICVLPKRGGKLARHRKSCPKYRGKK